MYLIILHVIIIQMEILKKLQSEVDDSNDNHQLILQEKETALEKVRNYLGGGGIKFSRDLMYF